jgi:cysteine synthase A
VKYENILETIGNTPHLRLKKLYPGAENVWIKLERSNPGGSIKDRIAYAMVRDAEEKGILKKGSTIIEPTSGNTGIGLAMVASVRGYRIILVMPESMSVERRNILKAYGAEIVLTPRETGMKGSMEKAGELAAEISGSWIPSQFDNPSNPAIHEATTAREILADFPGGLDYLVTGVGTGGHITGVARILKQQIPAMRVFAVEPADSPVPGRRASLRVSPREPPWQPYHICSVRQARSPPFLLLITTPVKDIFRWMISFERFLYF